MILSTSSFFFVLGAIGIGVIALGVIIGIDKGCNYKDRKSSNTKDSPKNHFSNSRFHIIYLTF